MTPNKNAPELAGSKGAIPKTDNADFTALRSAYAQQGHHLHSVTSKDGATTYWAERSIPSNRVPELFHAGCPAVWVLSR